MFSEYKKQYESLFKNNKTNVKINKRKILPIITIVIYYGNDSWNAPRSLYEYFNNDISDDILKYIPNYKLNLICPNEINELNLNKFKSDFKIIIEYIKSSDDSNKLLKTANKYQILNIETSLIIKEALKSKNIDIILNTNKEETNMCKAIEDLYNNGVKKGKLEGIKEGKEKGKEEATYEYVTSMYNKGIDKETISSLLGLDINKVNKILNC